MTKDQDNLRRLVQCNIAVAYQILHGVANAQAEAGVHILRAWFGLALLTGSEPDDASQFSTEFLRNFDRSRIPFPRHLCESAWEYELERLAESSESLDGACPLDTLRLLDHCDLLNQTFVRIRREGQKDRPKFRFRFPALPAKVPAEYWFVSMGIVLAILALVSIRPMIIEGSGKPWRAEYYAGITLAGKPALVRPEEKVDFDWTHSHPRDFVRKGYYSVRFDTCLQLDSAQAVNFELGSDDGARMFVNGRKLIDGWKTRSMTLEQASTQLDEGVHHLRVEYFEKGGSAIIRLRAQLDQRGLRNLSDREIFYPGDQIDPNDLCANVR